MRRRIVGALLALLLGMSACADAPEPGDLATFCSLLESGLGLSTTSTEADYAQLALVAPPEIRPTIDTLQTQARDFDELLNVEPPDLAALFTAKFDPEGQAERATLDRYAEDSCGLVVDRPPGTRWATHVRDNHANALWRDATTASFEVAAGGERILSATLVFDEAPGATGVEDACKALADFLVADGSDDATIRVQIGTVVVLEQPTPDGPCREP